MAMKFSRFLHTRVDRPNTGVYSKVAGWAAVTLVAFFGPYYGAWYVTKLDGTLSSIAASVESIADEMKKRNAIADEMKKRNEASGGVGLNGTTGNPIPFPVTLYAMAASVESIAEEMKKRNAIADEMKKRNETSGVGLNRRTTGIATLSSIAASVESIADEMKKRSAIADEMKKQNETPPGVGLNRTD